MLIFVDRGYRGGSGHRGGYYGGRGMGYPPADYGYGGPPMYPTPFPGPPMPHMNPV